MLAYAAIDAVPDFSLVLMLKGYIYLLFSDIEARKDRQQAEKVILGRA